MVINKDTIIPAKNPLMGFVGEHIMVKFLLIDQPSAYNAILGRTALNNLKAITSTSHLKMKFPTLQGVGEVKGVNGQQGNATTLQ